MIISGVTLGGATYKGGGPTDAILTLSPAVSGNTTWSLLNAGPLTLNAGTVYTITNNTAAPYSFTVKMWGAGSGGQGGYTTGTYTLNSGASIKALAGSAVPSSGYVGGGASAIYSASNDNVAYGVAGGGGGLGGQLVPGAQVGGGAGGAAVGGTGGTSQNSFGGQGGTQSAGGARGTGPAPLDNTPGSFRNGGNSGYGPPTATGGAGWGQGGYGINLSGGGGGGYYGGGSGGRSLNSGGGGGGGSSYIGGLTDGSMTQGVGSDPVRGTAGNPVTPGKIVLIYKSN